MLHDYPESAEEAASNLRLVLQLMGQHDISPNPRNFALCYEYVLARNPSLNQALDGFFAHGKRPDESTLQSLFDEHIAHGSTFGAMQRAQEELKRILRSVMLQLLQTGHDFAQYANGLGLHLSKLENDPNIELLREITREVVQETHEIERSSKDSSTRLINATEEVERLRKELEDARREASTDPLTGLLNRRAFTTVLTNAVAKAQADDHPLCLLMLDIDHFKNINDTYGHLVGDKVLRFIGRLLTQVVKGQDTLCRFGGEEFAILLPDTDLHGAIRVAETIRSRLNGSHLRLADSGKLLGQITASIGVACYREGGSVDELTQRADKALYEAKRQGRNRVQQEFTP
ncbi:MAG: GGDEF domain-containing protein [Halothiobacillaceae bacterium]